ncbi:MAG TPA: DNA translocase FtsK [Candidatus Acidoferrum sp.]|nr:DNA translocase FtsK [Candidatus Acidoferrum sp.]
MPRKDSGRPSEHHGFNDVIGVVLLGFALLLFVAMCSFDPADVSANTTDTNHSTRNWIGPIGAWTAQLLFQGFGVGAFVLPIVMVVGGLGCFFENLAYLKRRWIWSAILVLCCIGLLDLYTNPAVMDQLAKNPKAQAGFLERVARNLNATSAGGIAGHALNAVFRNFGTAGATIVYVVIDLVSMLFLTNFNLGIWIRGLVSREPREDLSGDETLTPEERDLTKRARELEREKRKLEQQFEKTARAKGEKPAKLDEMEAAKKGLGADMQPVPEPTIRDLSVPSRVKSKKDKPDKMEPPREVEPADEGEVIPAREVAAALTGDVLGKKSGDKKDAAGLPEPVVTITGSARPAGIPETPVANGEAAAIAPLAPLAPARKVAPRKKPLSVAAAPGISDYKLPSLDLLNMPDPAVLPTESKEDLLKRAQLMKETLAEFDIPVELGDITKGPTITRYELHPAPGVKLEKITALSNNIAAALKAERIHILAPVPGKSSVGIEVPNLIKTKVIMRDLLESEEWRTTKARIPLALGKDVYGHPIIADLGEMPHMLIAGSTGSGKSVCINSIVASLLYKFSPDQLRFVMIDPKVVELQQYNALPHLVVPVVTDPKKVILALRWVVNEMEKRYQIFAKVGVRNVSSFNSRPKDKPIPKAEPELPLMAKKEKIEASSEGFAVELDEQIVVPRDDDIVIPEKLSYIVVIIDELADLMLVAPADVEMAIARITQMARAAGIHCIVATQRPSVDVITGVIKANIPARIAFQVASRVDSRTILDAMGADKLLGKGDMLFLPPGSAKLNRAQGALITDHELQNIVDFIAKQGKPSYEMEIHQQLAKPVSNYNVEEGASDEDEDLIQQCIEVIRTEQKASVSLMQRRLRLGYTRAARIMDELEQRGIVGPSKGAEPRDILIDLDGGNAEGAATGHAV